MVEVKKTVYFCLQWLSRFEEQNIKQEDLIDQSMAEQCNELGFENDEGRAFSEKYGKAYDDHNELSKIIKNVKDVRLLGSAIYSKWNYLKNSRANSFEIFDQEDCKWFIIALTQLFKIADNFQGTLKKVSIKTNIIGWGCAPSPEKEVEQHLTITNDGRVWFSSYNYGKVGGKYERKESNNFKIEQRAANKLLKSFQSFFGNERFMPEITDVGGWEMEMTNTEGVTYKFTGSIDAYGECANLSDLVRDTLGMNNLFVFDENPNCITKVKIDYHRYKALKEEKLIASDPYDYNVLDYTERLVVNRKKGTVEFIQKREDEVKISHKYEMKEQIKEILENIDPDELLKCNGEDNSYEVMDEDGEIRDYKIVVETKFYPPDVLTGRFDKKGLPKGFEYFIESIIELIEDFQPGEIFDPSIYRRVRRSDSEYIFCSVTFNKSKKRYYYLTDDDSIKVGDYVDVPTGDDGHEMEVKVVDIEYFEEENAPIPIQDMKRIIRKHIFKKLRL